MSRLQIYGQTSTACKDDQTFNGALTILLYFLKFLLFHLSTLPSVSPTIKKKNIYILLLHFSLLSLILLCPSTFSGAFTTSTIMHFISRIYHLEGLYMKMNYFAIKNGCMGSVSLTDSLSEREDSLLFPFCSPLISEDWLVTVARLEEW